MMAKAWKDLKRSTLERYDRAAREAERAEAARQEALLEEDDEEMREYLEATCCPVCNGEGAYMGTLGDSPWFRCVSCGMEYTESGYVSQGPVELTVAEEDA